MARLHKHFTLSEYKALDDEGNFTGILSTYGNEDLVGDVCDEGCWDQSVIEKGGKFPLLWQHDTGEPIGSFVVTDTRSALNIRGHFNPGVQRGREAYALLKAGDVCGLSVGFDLKDWAYVDGVRHITKAELWEGSFVTFPANPAAYAEAKAMAEEKQGKLRKSVAALSDFKSLPEEIQNRILMAIDEALTGLTTDEEAEQKEETDPEEESQKEDPVEPEGDVPEEDTEGQKMVLAVVRELKSSTQAMRGAVKKVST